MSEIVMHETLTATEVASYLRRHAEFLREFPDLALNLVVPREQGATTSLASYQLEVLREKNHELTKRLHELIEIANENEQLMKRVHALTLKLMRASSLSETLQHIAAGLIEDFHTELVRLIVFRADLGLPHGDWLICVPEGIKQLPVFAAFLSQDEPLCGRLRQEKLDFLFGEQAKNIRSTALLAVNNVGMLAIGSTVENRFYPGMGTMFLKLIAEVIAVAIERFPVNE